MEVVDAVSDLIQDIGKIRSAGLRKLRESIRLFDDLGQRGGASLQCNVEEPIAELLSIIADDYDDDVRR